MKCPGCGAVNPPEHSACRQCEIPLPSLCGHCGFVCDAKSRFCGGCGTALQPVAGRSGGLPARATFTQRSAAAQRRHLTVMFCDLVGSTDLSLRIDPEELSAVLRQYRRVCKQLVGRYNGFVARYTGDGLLAYFGYPAATAHDAERAVRAGLDIIDSIRKLQLGPQLALHTRIGVASGEVVVGEVIGDGASREVTVVGEAPNLAARLQGICAVDTLVISDRTQGLIGGLFEYSDLGYRDLKGFDKPVRAHVVLGEAVVESRFEATHGRHSGPMLGRERELLALREALIRTGAGVCQLVVVCGEEGIGKSHLLENFIASLPPDLLEVLRIFGAPHATGNVLHPIISYLRRHAGIEACDSNAVKLDKLTGHVARLGPVEPRDLFLLATLLSIAVDGRAPAPQMNPSALKQRTLELLVSHVTSLCRKTPVVLLAEDLHWLDATSMEFLNLLIARSQQLPLLIIATYRPEYKPQWLAGCQTASIEMTHLDSDAARSLIRRLSGGKALPEEIVTDILDKTDGIPLFIEEITKTILESPALVEKGDRFVINGNVAFPAIPDTLQDSLAARLDRPGITREVAQIGSALGREFRLDLLQAVVDKPSGAVDAAIDELVAAQLVSRWGTAPQQSCRFRHTLIQQTAYRSMLQSTRLRLHGRIARILSRRFRSRVQGRPDLLARHYTAAQMYEQGFRYWFLASQQALRHFAHKEVAVHLHRGLALANRLPDDVELVVMEFEMRALLASTLMVLYGPGHEEVGKAYQRAHDFCRGREGLVDSFRLEFVLCRYLWASGRIRQAVLRAESLLPAVVLEPERGRFMAVHLLLGISLWHAGDSDRALACLRKVSECYDAQKDAQLVFTYMIDFGVLGRCYEALALVFMGRQAEARTAARECLDLARELDNPHAIGSGLVANQVVAVASGQFEECLVYADECSRLATAQGFPEFAALARVCAGIARLRSGTAAGAGHAGEQGSLDMIREGVEQWERAGFSAWRPLLHGILAEAYLEVGKPGLARTELTTARTLMQQQEELQSAGFLGTIERRLSELAQAH